MRWGIAGISLLMIATNTIGATDPSFRNSKSIGYISATKDQQVESYLDREPVPIKQHPGLVTEGYRAEAGPIQIKNIQVRRHNDCNCDPQDFAISSAWISLQTDEDFDGYYRRFELTFNADVYSGDARLYAYIYLSFEGGPWNLLYTTDRFNLAASSTRDEYVVETELDSGYPTGYYDVLIELYDANSDRFLLDYGPYQNADLSALPMEDRRHDFINHQEDSYEIYGSGAFGWITLLLLSGVHLTRKTRSTLSYLTPSSEPRESIINGVYNAENDRPAGGAI